jgi:outer membrane lipoprotein-sorting protein
MNSFTIRNCALMILLFFLSSSAIAQFSADMVTTNGDVTQTSKFYSEKPYYRMDMEEDGQQMFVVVNTKTNTTQAFMPSQKMYMEMKSDDNQSTSNDVFQSLEEQKKKYETKLVGKEYVNGYECEVYEVLADGSPVTTYWQSAEIEYPIKVVTGQNKDMIMELKNIEKGDVDNALFEVPAGYTKMDMQGMMQMK